MCVHVGISVCVGRRVGRELVVGGVGRELVVGGVSACAVRVQGCVWEGELDAVRRRRDEVVGKAETKR